MTQNHKALDVTPESETTFQQVADVIGLQLATALSVEFGGRTLYIPKRAPADGMLVRVVGQAAADLLARRFGGDQLAMPLTEGKRNQIVVLRQRGFVVTEIAKRLHCGERHVWQVLREFREHGGVVIAEKKGDLNQLDIFASE